MSGTTASGSGRTAGVPRLSGGGANRWTVLIVLCVSLLFVALDTTILYVAVPSVTEDLRPGPVELLWIVDVYPLIAASLLILFGTLGDRVGRRRILLLGYGLFGLASAAAALAPNPQILMVARALLGIGGAMIMPATLSILRQVFPTGASARSPSVCGVRWPRSVPRSARSSAASSSRTSGGVRSSSSTSR